MQLYLCDIKSGNAYRPGLIGDVPRQGGISLWFGSFGTKV